MFTKFHQILCLICVACGFVACVDNDDDVPANYYTSNQMTAAAFLEDNSDRVGMFVNLLKRTPYFSLLSTYGNYTVFAPTDSAVTEYLNKSGFKSVDSIPALVCDTLVRNHIVEDGVFFTTDVGEGTLSKMNMAESYVEFSLDNDTTNGNTVQYFVNKTSRMIEFDDSVTNGVVHFVNRFLERTSDMLPDVIAKDSTLTIFSQALRLTGLADSLMFYEDLNYTWDSEKSKQDSCFTGKPVICRSQEPKEVNCKWPEHRYFKFTAFVEPDEVYKKNGINSLEDLIARVKQVYDQVYPQDAGLYDDDFKNRKNPLNRFVSYHLLDRVLTYYDVIMTHKIISQCWLLEKSDPEEFYETMAGTLMRFSYPDVEDLYINRMYRDGDKISDAKDPSLGGVKVLKPTESGETNQVAQNGMYHYLDDIIWYDLHTRDEVLNCRIRMDGNVLSPDFQNSGARGRYEEEKMIGLRNGFIKNIRAFGRETNVGCHGDHPWWNSYKQNAVNITGIFDITFKLPPVPTNTYEIRIGYTVGVERGVVQFYLNNDPCGIPVDLRVYGGDVNIGWQEDVINTATGKPEKAACKSIDKAMRNHGYMKAMDSYHNVGATDTFRDHTQNLRRILTTMTMNEGETYELRCRQVLEDPKCYWTFDYIELVPKSIYANPEGEDWH